MKTRQFKDEYKITHSAVTEMAAYLLNGWPTCCGTMSISAWIVSFTEDMPEPLDAKNALLVTVAETEREALVTLRDYIEKQGKKQDEAVELLTIARAGIGNQSPAAIRIDAFLDRQKKKAE